MPIADIAPQIDVDIVRTEGTLVAIQRHTETLLRSLPEFSGCAVYIEDSKTIEDDLNNALASVAMSLLVTLGDAQSKPGGHPGAVVLDGLEVIVTIIERPTLNRGTGGSGVTANRAREIVAKELKGVRLEDLLSIHQWSAAYDRPVFRTPANAQWEGCVVRSVVFRITAVLN